MKHFLILASLLLASTVHLAGHTVTTDHETTPAWFKAASQPAPGSGALLLASFTPFKPSVRFYNDATYFYIESDSMPDATLMPNPMVGITAWQQQIPITVGYFGHITNPETDATSLGYGQPNVWRVPLVPVAAASPIPISAGNFQRGAIAIAVNGIPIFNPRNNTGRVSYEIGELDAYGGHCGRADDYHYHIAPTHLTAVVGGDKPIAWALDGYPIYGYLEPDGSALQPFDADGGHNHGSWGYHYHARGSAITGPQSPYLMNAMHGTVVNYGGQVDPQPTVGAVTTAGSPLSGALITGFTRPAKDQYELTYTVSGTTYKVAWQVDRIAHTVAIQREAPTGNTNGTYTSAARFNSYPLSGTSLAKLPDTGQTLNATATFGEDSDYAINPPAYTDNGNGTVTDTVTGLMWQKTDSGEMTWDTARTSAPTALGGFSDWRLPTAQEAFSILNHNTNPALNSTYFVNNAGGTPGYFWTSDLFYGDNTKVWATNAGGGIGPHPKTATTSAGGSSRFHARYVRGSKPNVGHNYINNNDGTVTDVDTGLMWSQTPSSTLGWVNAITYAENLTLAGYADWRLPNIKELQSLIDVTRATASGSTLTPCINRILFPAVTATAHWSSTSVKSGTPAQAWLADLGVTTTSSPARNQQGIVSYEPYASAYPALAVRSVATASVSQGRAATTTINLLPAGQRVSGVGQITATDGTIWTVPAATQFAIGNKASDLYNEVTGVKPANIAAAAAAIASVPTVVVDADGEVITGYIFADNYFELYVNGTLVAVDPVTYTPFNSCVVKFKAKRPITYAIKLVDWEENLGLGTELNGGNNYYAGDGGLIASFSDGTVTNGNWKAQSFNIAPLDNPNQVVELANGTHDSSAAITHALTDTAYALHYAVPADWFATTFNDTFWPAATTFTEAAVGVNNKPAYTNFPAQFSASGAQFIWSSNLVLDNEVIVRFTGSAASSTAPAFTTQPSSATVIVGGAATFTAAASGNPTPTYQWQKSGVTIAGATSTTYTIASTGTGDAGSYTVVATNSSGAVTSSSATLTVNPAPPVLPTTQLVITGKPVALGIVTSTTGTIKWQVSTDSGSTYTDLADNATYRGTTTAVLEILQATNALNNNRYRYQVTLSGQTTASTATTLSVKPAYLLMPVGLKIDSANNLYVTDAAAQVVVKITSDFKIASLAGTAIAIGSTDGTGTVARFNEPTDLVINDDGSFLLTDTSNASVRKVTTAGVVTTFAGTSGSKGSTDGTGAAARFSAPVGITRDATGNVYVADQTNHVIRRITPAGVVTTLAGTAGTVGSTDGTGAAARFNLPTGVAMNSVDALYVADLGSHTLRKVTSSGVVTTFAGTAGTSGSVDGTGTAARFNKPSGLALDTAGNLYVADTGNSTVRKVSPAGVVTTLAGLSAIAGLKDGTGALAWFNEPEGVTADASGNLYLADTGNAVIRKITPAGVVTTLTLTGTVPVITTQPASVSVTTGSAASLSVTASGDGVLTYQWKKDGTDVSGATTATYAISATSSTSAGSYTVVVSNFLGSVTSSAATLTVNAAPAPAPTPAPSSGGGGGGGGGAPSYGFLALLALWAWRRWQRSVA